LQVHPQALSPRTRPIRQDIIAFHDPQHPVSEQYRKLYAKMQDGIAAAESYLLLFTAAARGVGTTTAVLNLAVTSCTGGRRRVVVVDANLGCPAAMERLGATHEVGLADVLRGSAGLEQALAVTALPHLLVLGAPTPNRSEGLFLEDNIRWLAARLRERFDLILVDGPAWEGGPADSVLASAADAVYLVVDSAAADTPTANRIARTLAQRGSRFGGLIVVQ
jgi:Mrp family chromosome partitioning ATPase